MHVALVTHGLPQPNSNGGPMTCWAVMKALLDADHRVTVVVLSYSDDPFSSDNRRQVILEAGAQLTSVAVAVSCHAPRSALQRRAAFLKTVFRPQLHDLFPTARMSGRMKEVLEGIAPDVVFAYHWDSLASLLTVDLPIVGAVGDPWHLPNLRRWSETRPQPTLSYLGSTASVWRDVWHGTRAMVSLLNRCEVAGCFQKQEADWLTRKGASCAYLPSAITDPLCGRQAAFERSPQPARRPRVLLGPSNLNATSTNAGLRAFAIHILPRLETAFGRDGFEVRIVGEGSPPVELARLLPHPGIMICGRIEPPDDEFFNCDVQLVPTPYVLGIRLRIIVGFAFGAAVVADASEKANIPEMVDGTNALLGQGGPAVGDALIRALRDAALRRQLGRAARETYERNFSVTTAGGRIVSLIEKAAPVRALRAGA